MSSLHFFELRDKLPPSMMCLDELLYLYWLTSDIYTGVGEIVDAGCLRGASTICLAAGIRHNRTLSGNTVRIHTYDLFEYHYHSMAGLFPGNTMQSGDSFLPQFMADIADFHALVEVNAGDITKRRWNGKPIEILFLDLIKSNEINNHVLREYFPCLIPQRSIVIQQDYFHFYCYWIHLTMWYLADYFQIFPSPQGGTLAFRLLKPIPLELLEKDYVHDLPIAEKIYLMDTAVAAHAGVDRLHIMAAKARMLVDLGDYVGVLALVETIFRSPDWRTDHLLGEMATIIKLLRMKVGAFTRSPIVQLIEEWDDRINARTELQLIKLIHDVTRIIYIWGAGPTGNKVLQQARYENVPIAGFIDRDTTLVGTPKDELMIAPPEILNNCDAIRKPFILIGSACVREIALQLENLGYHYGTDYVF